jgi:hypothetical protein
VCARAWEGMCSRGVVSCDGCRVLDPSQEEPGADVRQTRSRCVETIFKLFLGMAVRRQLKPGEQPGLEDLEAITHPMAYPTLLACLACPDHAVQTAAASQLGMLATSPDHKRDMIACVAPICPPSPVDPLPTLSYRQDSTPSELPATSS